MTKDDFKKWRKAMGWSQIKTAAALEKTHRTILRYEAGQTRVPASVILAAAFLALQREDGRRVAKSLSGIRAKYGLKGFTG